MKNLFKIIAAASLIAFGTAASAVTIPPPLSIDFGTGIGTGGSVVEVTPGDVHGTNIAINAVNIANAPDASANGGYTANALLNFDTSAGTISIVGTVGAAGLGTSSTLFSGVINDGWIYDAGTISIFTADGAGGISTALADFIGMPALAAYEYVGFSLSIGDSALSTDLLITPSDRTPEVPVPAAAWLFGSGLIGMVGVARRRKV